MEELLRTELSSNENVFIDRLLPTGNRAGNEGAIPNLQQEQHGSGWVCWLSVSPQPHRALPERLNNSSVLLKRVLPCEHCRL